MIRVLKTLLLWLLMASLPVRGLAAVDMSCGAILNGSAASGMPAHLPAEATHQHELDTSTLRDLARSQVSAAEHSMPGHDSHKDLNGGSCAACFIGAVAPPSAALRTNESSGSEAVIHFTTVSFTGFITAGLERPPRHLPT